MKWHKLIQQIQIFLINSSHQHFMHWLSCNLMWHSVQNVLCAWHQKRYSCSFDQHNVTLTSVAVGYFPLFCCGCTSSRRYTKRTRNTCKHNSIYSWELKLRFSTWMTPLTTSLQHQWPQNIHFHKICWFTTSCCIS